MTVPALDMVGVSKVFRIWKHPRDMLVETVTGRTRHSEFKALDDVTICVERGSIVGIMGRNGAGKSTLLRIVAGTLDATSGRVAVDGRVAAILELGTGFHPDYSGRDNIRLGGMCLGLSEKEVQARADEIIDFSELREFIDQPFRTYSSGMQSRLTFAVATAIDPDILIIDEALSVGDARFQLKSFDRVRNFKKQGKTILLVSHDINAINTICDEAVLLERGVVRSKGTPSVVGNIYHELLFGERYGQSSLPPQPPRSSESTDENHDQGCDDQAGPVQDPLADAPASPTTPRALSVARLRRRRLGFSLPQPKPRSIFDGSEMGERQSPDGPEATDGPREHRYGDGAARIVSIEFRDVDDRPVTRLDSLAIYDLVCKVESFEDINDICFGFLVRDRRGTDVFGWDSRCGETVISRLDLQSPRLACNETAEVRVRFRNNFAGGIYFLTVALARLDGEKIDLRFDALEFNVASTRSLFTASIINLEVRPGSVDRHRTVPALWRKY